MYKEDIKKAVPYVLLSLAVGSAGSIIVTKLSSFNPYEYTPSFMPPKPVFMIVWTLLFILMGIANYLINKSSQNGSEDEETNKADTALNTANHTYYFSLAVNFIYSIVFFVVKWPFIAFLVCVYLTILVIQTICQYFEFNKIAAYMNIPYAIWTAFASILTFAFWWLNW